MGEDTRMPDATTVIICGGGPTGMLLSALLGQLEVPNVVLERDTEITTDPRGIALDEDGIRNIQAIDMYDRVHSQIALCHNLLFISGSGKDLQKLPFFTIDPTTSDGNTGHVGFVFHKQPQLERAVRDAAAACSTSKLLTGCTVQSVSEDADSVTVQYTDAEGNTRSLSAAFLVGADGKTGYVRKKYLEPKGVRLERCEGTNYEESWVALNWHITLPTPETHPDFPLWQLGYTPQQVYDTFFPENFRFLCNPERPSVCGRFGRPEDRLWRFEFVIREGEDPVHMATKEKCSGIIYPYITHPGRRYGVEHDVRYPVDCIETLRARPFSFSARSCNYWALERVIIVGDAAHVFPPFGGQGITSGFRDAIGLAWRLAHLHRNPDVDYAKLLRGWYLERKQQLEHSLAATIRNGEFVTNAGLVKAFVRDWVMWAMQQVPSWKRQMENGGRGTVRYQHASGLPFLPEYGGGINLPQVYARCLTGPTRNVIFTDDLLFANKTSIVQLLVLVDGTDQLASAVEEAYSAVKLSSGLLRMNEATMLINDLEAAPPDDKPDFDGWAVARIASGDEFASDEMLCRNRPEPRYYNPFRIRDKLRAQARFVLIRHDRFVFAACKNADEFHVALRSLPGCLHVR